MRAIKTNSKHTYFQLECKDKSGRWRPFQSIYFRNYCKSLEEMQFRVERYKSFRRRMHYTTIGALPHIRRRRIVEVTENSTIVKTKVVVS